MPSLIRWPFGAFSTFGCFLLVVLVSSLHGWSQDSLESQNAPPSRLSIPSQVPNALEKGAIKPDAFYLVDAQGNFVFVPRLAYEEYEKFIRDRDRQGAAKIPEYVIESLQGEVQLRNDLAEIQWKGVVSLTNPAIEIVRIPLMMANQNLVNKPRTVGGRLSFLRVSEQKGLEWWIQQDGAERYEITFNTIQKVSILGQQTSFRLELPEAPTELKIHLEGANQQVQVVGPSIPAIETKSDDTRTESVVRLSGGTHVISWRQANENKSFDAIEVESISRYSLSVASQTWSGSTRMVVRPIGRMGPREFQVRLPEGMRWISRDTGATEQRATIERTSVPEKSELDSDPAGDNEWLLIRIREFDTDLPADVVIPWEWNVEEKENGQIRFRTPEISGVVKHEGRLEIETPVGNDLWWKNSPWLQFLSQDRASDGSGLLRYTFRFLQQTAILDGTLNRVDSTLRIRPNYLFQVDANQVRLDALIELPRTARNILDPRLQMAGWRIERIERNGAAMDYREETNGEVVLSSLNVEGTTNDSTEEASSVLSIRITASRTWQSDSTKRMDLTVPSFSSFDPTGTNRIVDHGNGAMVILYADNWKPKAEAQNLEGLVAESRIPVAIEELMKEVLPNARLPEENFLSFRFQEGSNPVVWSGDWQKLERRIAIRQEFDLVVNDDHCLLDQRYRLTIANEPLRRLPLIVSRKLVNSSRFGGKALRIQLDGKDVEWTQLPDTSISDLLPPELRPEEWSVIELSRTEFSGEVDLKIESQLPHMADLTEGPVDFSMPLTLLPIKDNSGNLPLSNRYRIQSSRTIRSTLPESYRSSFSDDITGVGTLILPEGAFEIPLRIQKLDIVGTSKVDVSKVWLQTALTQQQRRDRLVIRFKTDLRMVQLELPESIRTIPYELVLDGRRVDGRVQGESSELSIELDSKEPQHTYVLEVWTWTSRAKSRPATIDAEIPRLRGASNTPSLIWQVVLPTSEVLLWSGSNLFVESRWTLKSFGFVREEKWSQSECEEWIGATKQDILGQQANIYVASCIGTSIPLTMVTVPRTYLWLPLGVLAIIFAGVGSSVGWLHRPWFWLAVAIGISFLVPIAPDLTVVLAQGLILGSVLVLLHRVSSWLMDRRLQKRSVFASRTSKPSFSGSLSNRGISEKEAKNLDAVEASTAVRSETGP